MEQAPRTYPKPCELDARSFALGPDFASRRRASSVVKPPFEMTSGALAVVLDGDVRPSTSLD